MHRSSQIRKIVDDYRTVLARGHDFDVNSACRPHPDLMPDLQQALEELRANSAAEAPPASDDPKSAPTAFATVDFAAPAGGVQIEAVGDALRYMGNYRLEEQLGAGSFGRVWRATQMTLSRTVAVKVLHGEHQDATAIARFRREARLLARLKHPNVVAVLEVGEYEGLHFIAMEFVDGQDLSKFLRKGLPAPQWSARAIHTVASAIAHAHEANLIHRDLKPANILVDSHENLKVTDFGLARQTGDATELTATNAIVGTLAYMAPEQAGGNANEVGPPADIYAIGATLYHLLTGRPPFASDPNRSALAVLADIRDRDPPPPRQVSPERNIPRDLETICLKCLEKEPAARYASAAALAADLERFLDGEPILARPTPIWEKVYRKVRRRPLVAALVAGILLVTLVGGTVAAALSRQTQQLSQEVAKSAEKRLEIEAGKKKAESERETAKSLAASKAIESQRAEADRAWQEYIADMQQLEQLWKAGKAAQVRELLAKHVPSAENAATKKDLRGIEWYVWNHRRQNTGQTLPQKRARSAAFNSDGSLLALATTKDVTLWDVRTSKAIHQFEIAANPGGAAQMSGDTHQEFDRSVSLSANGKYLAATTFHVTPKQRLGTVRVWDLATKAEVLAIVRDPELSGRAVLLSPDDKYVIAGGYGQQIKIWDLATGVEVEQKPDLYPRQPTTNIPQDKKNQPWSGQFIVWDLQYWSDGRTLLVRSDMEGPIFRDGNKLDESAQKNMAEGELLNHIGRGWAKQERVTYGEKPSVGIFAAVRRDDETLEVRQMSNPRVNGVQVEQLEGGPVTAVLVHKQNLFAAGRDKVIRRWAVMFPEETLELRGSEEPISGLAISPNGKVLVSFPETRIWRLDEKYEFSLPLTAPASPTSGSPSGKYLVDLFEGNVRIRHGSGLGIIATIPAKNFFSVWFSPDERRMAVAFQTETKQQSELWDMQAEKRIATLPAFGAINFRTAAAFSRDGRLLAGHGCVFDAITGKLIIDCGNQPAIATAFSPNEKYVAFAGQSETVVWDLAAKREIGKLPHGGRSVAISDDAAQVIFVDVTPNGPNTSVWEVATQRQIETPFGPENYGSLALSADGQRVYLMRQGLVSVFSNRRWNHLVTLKCPTPYNVRELDALIEQIAKSATPAAANAAAAN